MRLAARTSALAAALCCGWAVAAERPEETRAERESLAGIHSALDHKNCKLAASRLNDGLAARYPGAYLMAGTMYEEGVCLKANWERAVQMYERALESGAKAGGYKLVSGYALPTREPASAVWWAQRMGGGTLPPPCRVADSVHKDAEAYVATLRAWPAGQVAACAYVAGVLGTVTADAEYPPQPLRLQLAGRVRGSFSPAQSRLVWVTEQIEFSGDPDRDRSSRSTRDGLRAYLEEVGARALRRYGPAPSIDPEWKVEVEYVFKIAS